MVSKQRVSSIEPPRPRWLSFDQGETSPVLKSEIIDRGTSLDCVTTEIRHFCDGKVVVEQVLHRTMREKFGSGINNERTYQPKEETMLAKRFGCRNSNAVVGVFFGMVCFMMVSVPSSWAAGLLTPKDSNLPVLEIKDHAVSVVIEDGYAVTTVEQIFANPNSTDLEAVYSFPVPEKAAVSEFTMWIDGKPVHGEVLEKKKAREVYEDQKTQNKNAGLTEQNGYKTFEVSVYPVRAGQETKIRLGYIQPFHVDTGIGRYVYPLEEGGVDEEALAFWSTNEKVSGTFSFDLNLRSGYPIADLRLPNHPNAKVTHQ